MIQNALANARILLRRGWILLTLGFACYVLAPARGQSDEISKSDAAEIESIRSGLRIAPIARMHSPLDMIGALVTSHFWTDVLPLGKEQASAIMKLDDLVQQSHDQSFQVDAKFPADDLTSYRAYVDRSHTRRREAFRHAQRVVSLGLLTEPQAALVIQRVLTHRRPSHSLGDDNVQELLGMTSDQKARLVEVWADANAGRHRNSPSQSAQEQQKTTIGLSKVTNPTDAAAMGILLRSQLEQWSRLTALRALPAEPPELPAPTDAEAAQVRIDDIWPIFRRLDERADALKLSENQRKHLKDLEEVTRTGLFWISLRNPADPTLPADVHKAGADRVARIRAEFVTHAAFVALKGILTESQALAVLWGGC
jgi:hypothetical protein